WRLPERGGARKLYWPCVPQGRGRFGLVAHAATMVLALCAWGHERLALWHRGRDGSGLVCHKDIAFWPCGTQGCFYWPCGTRAHNCFGLVAPAVILVLALCAAGA